MPDNHYTFHGTVLAGTISTVVGGVALASVMGWIHALPNPANPASTEQAAPPSAAQPAAAAPASPPPPVQSAAPVSPPAASSESTDNGSAAPVADSPKPQRLQAADQAYLWHWNGASFDDPQALSTGSTVEVIRPWPSDASYVEVWVVDADGERTGRGVALRSTLVDPTSAVIAEAGDAPSPPARIDRSPQFARTGGQPRVAATGVRFMPVIQPASRFRTGPVGGFHPMFVRRSATIHEARR